MTSLIRSNEHPTETTFSSKRIYTDYPSVRSEKPQYELSDATLSQTLALIKYIGLCGYSEFDTIHIVLSRLRRAIMVLLKHCVRADREDYCEFIDALLKSSSVVVEKLIIKAVDECSRRVDQSLCHLIIKEVYNLLRLIYGLTNPLNLPRILTEEYGLPAQHRLSVSSLQTNLLLEATYKFQTALLAHFETLDVDTSVDFSVNATPPKLYLSIVLYTMDIASKLMTTITTNIVPTNDTFLYFKSLLRNKDIQITDIENFDTFITHFLKVDELAREYESTPLFDLQRNLIKTIFLEIIGEFPVCPLTWCTPAQTINYIQIFIDVYNRVYEEDLYIEQVWSPTLKMESTVIKKEKNIVRIEEGHYKLHFSNFDPIPVPNFVKFFDGPETNTSSSPYQNAIFSPRQTSGTVMGPFRYSGIEETSGVAESVKSSPPADNGLLPDEQGACLSSTSNSQLPYEIHASYVPTHKEYVKVYELNELVALEVRAARIECEHRLGHSRVCFRDNTCFKCKYVPWHKHKLHQ